MKTHWGRTAAWCLYNCAFMLLWQKVVGNSLDLVCIAVVVMMTWCASYWFMTPRK